MNEKNIIENLRYRYGEQILPVYELPEHYCIGNLAEIKAIYLGCDPSNRHSTTLPFAFAHKCNLPVFNSFIEAHTLQLKQIGLSWENVYAQNLCRNYFKEETSKNKIWKKVAEEFWIPELVKELEKFDPKTPVLLTSQLLLEVLGKNGYEKLPAPEFYECKTAIPIPAHYNKLGRNLIPLYRGKSLRYEVTYHLVNEKWNEYRESVINYISGI